jgi:hypothetical protein
MTRRSSTPLKEQPIDDPETACRPADASSAGEQASARAREALEARPGALALTTPKHGASGRHKTDDFEHRPNPGAVALALAELTEALADPTLAARTAAYLAGDLPGTEAP